MQEIEHVSPVLCQLPGKIIPVPFQWAGDSARQLPAEESMWVADTRRQRQSTVHEEWCLHV